jgi:hypothetical protein
MKDLLPFVLIAGVAYLVTRKKPEPVKLDPVEVTALRMEKPIPFPTSFQYEEAPAFPESRSEQLFRNVFAAPTEWEHLRQGQI